MRRALSLKIFAAALAVVGVGSAFSAPSQPEAQRIVVSDEVFKPGDDGVDYASVTGPQNAKDRIPACADPARRGDLLPCLQ
jgi:hypothetical protein